MAHAITPTLDHAPHTHEASIGARFCGPPKSGTGGYAIGLVAKNFDCAVEITLKRPLPLDRPMQVVTDGQTAGLFHEGHELASARATDLRLDLPTPITFQEAAAARAGFSGYRVHPFPNCFVCGTHRSCGDGMCLFTGETEEGVVASSWVPNEEFADEDGLVKPEFLGAALDCPGAWALIGKYDITGPVVLGRMTYASYRPVDAGGRYVVMGWALGQEGRKSFCGTAIFDQEGNVCAAAKATWFQLK
ncbi:MAG: hypothetical protein WBG86_00800 [Polyangiales bacterium]